MMRSLWRTTANLVLATVAGLAVACGDPDPPEIAPAPVTATVTPTPRAETTTPADLPPSPPTWVEARLRSVAELYAISEEGRDLFTRLDVRQMRGEPGFFGSYGYKSWTGVGEAKPATIMHELGHAYWGAFPITGVPELSWDTEDGEELSPAMRRYHADVLEFMRQPPGPYEPLRSRLRNIPALSEDSLDGLVHAVEADIVSMVGGDLDLVPPILRKYWDRLLGPGPWGSWYEALAWFKALDGEPIRLANQYLGFQHVDLRPYESLDRADSASLPDLVVDALRREERRRLQDFAEQFELLIGDPDNEENFDFWRGYLRDMRRLNKGHPGLLESLNLPTAAGIAGALTLIEDLDGLDHLERAARISRASEETPLVVHFLPVLENRTLLGLFSGGPDLPDVPTLKGTVAFVDRLERLAPVTSEVIGLGSVDPVRGAEALSSFLENEDFEKTLDLDLLLGLLRDSDPDTARAVATALDASTVRRLLEAVPAALRSLLEPEKLLDVLGVSQTSTPDELAQGIDLLVEHTSGNFRIDEPFFDALYRVFEVRTATDAVGTLEVAGRSRFPMEGYLLRFPEPAVAMLASDLDLTADLATKSGSITFPPARFVYRLIHADPGLAAATVIRLDGRGDDDLVIEALVHFAYDSRRLAAVPRLPISLENVGDFLTALANRKGVDWLEGRLRRVVSEYGVVVEKGALPKDFLAAYRTTLEAAVESLEDGPSTTALIRIVDDLFAP